jgi:uncharacterized membrane protein
MSKKSSLLGLPVGRRRKRRIPVGRLVRLGAAAAAVVPVAQKAGKMLDSGRKISGEAGKLTGLTGEAGKLTEGAGKLAKGLSQGKSGGEGPPKLSHLIVEQIDVAVPRTVAYNQWTQMEMLPRVLKGVESVEQNGRRKEETKWKSKIGPSRREWTAKITEQVPDERIAWKTEGGVQHYGVVTFHSLGADEGLTRVIVDMRYDPKGPIENIAKTLRIPRRRVRRDLRLFKHFLELRGEETGAWRGEIEAKHRREEQSSQSDRGEGDRKQGQGESQSDRGGRDRSQRQQGQADTNGDGEAGRERRPAKKAGGRKAAAASKTAAARPRRPAAKSAGNGSTSSTSPGSARKRPAKKAAAGRSRAASR